eukprot:scaffold38796_cov19-Tisochrysis_lutea.AAC.1
MRRKRRRSRSTTASMRCPSEGIACNAHCVCVCARSHVRVCICRDVAAAVGAVGDAGRLWTRSGAQEWTATAMRAVRAASSAGVLAPGHGLQQQQRQHIASMSGRVVSGAARGGPHTIARRVRPPKMTDGVQATEKTQAMPKRVPFFFPSFQTPLPFSKHGHLRKPCTC